MPVPTITPAYLTSITAFPQGPEFIQLHTRCADREIFYLKAKDAIPVIQAEIAEQQALLDGTIGNPQSNPFAAARQLAISRLTESEIEDAILSAESALQDAVTAAATYQAAHAGIIPAELVPTMPD